MLPAKITHVVLCSVNGLYCVHDIFCCIHTNLIVYVWNYALCCMHILYCVYNMYMSYTIAYIECMPTNVYMYVNWMLYSNIRHTLFLNLNWLPNYCALDLTLLTCGNPTLPYEQNEIIFKHVFEYIKRSERFLVV